MVTKNDKSIRQALLRWYKKNARDLPWRETKDPYAIWVSEIMLQQTRVDTVIPYYQKFLKSFPTAKKLAQADEDTVLSHWSGLGYYRRARLLHKGVQEVVEKYEAQVPANPEQRLSIPGIGRYTAGAIGSIAFDQQEPLVDGNVTRVFCRIYGIETPIGKAETENALWEKAETLIKGKNPGDFNQALMELGATVCTPKKAKCSECPVQKYCEAFAQNKVEELPIPRERKKAKQMQLVTVTAYKDPSKTKLWMIKGQNNLFGGLWNLPLAEISQNDSQKTPSMKEMETQATKLLKATSASSKTSLQFVGKIEHILTHRHFHVHIFHSARTSARQTKDKRWVNPDELHTLGVSKLVKKILATEQLELELT